MRTIGKLLLKLGALAATFGFVYDTPVSNNKHGLDRILFPEPIAILDDSYAHRTFGFVEEGEAKMAPYLNESPAAKRIPVFDSDNPEEIEEMLRSNPAAYEAFTIRAGWIDKQRDMTRSDFLRAIAKLTRDLNGAPLKRTRSGHNDVLEQIICEMYADHFSRDTFPIIMNTAVEVAKKDGEFSLSDLTQFPFLAFNFGHYMSRNHGKQSLCKNPEVMSLVADFYSRMVKAGANLEVVAAPQLAGIYNHLKDKSAFDSFTGELEQYVKFVAVFDKNLVQAAVDALLKSGSIEDIGGRSSLLLRYVAQLNIRGELDISRALDSFSYRRNGLDSGFVDKLLSLHKHYGILQFSRLQKNDNDMSLIDELLKNTNPDYNEDKPLAVVCIGREGSEFAMDTFSVGNFYDTLKTLSSGYKVMVYSVSAESGPLDALAQAHSVAGKKADLLVLGGHGSPSGISFGNSNWDYCKKDRVRGRGAINYGVNAGDQVLDLSDSSVIRAVEPFVSEFGKVVLYSCSTGEGRSNAVNIANHVAFNLPGRIVYAPDAKTTGVELKLDPSGLVEDVKFMDSDNSKVKTGTYSVVKPRD